MFYVDDAVFVGQWCDGNINTPVHVLEYFFQASGNVSKAGSRSCWRNIVNEVRILSNQGIKVLDYMRIKLGNEESTAFWDDNWIGGKVLKYSFPRIYALEIKKAVTVNSKMCDMRLENSLRRRIRGGVEHVQFNELSDMLQSVSLIPYSDRWVWLLEGSGEFFVASIQKIIDDNRLSTVDTRTLWIKCVPIKKLSHAEEKTRVRLLPLNQPLNGYSLHTLLMTSESDRRITTALKAAREEVLRCIDEKQ
nr:RNA-directed DNA polymerase, eukaryota, reverse transcriptase zinc-binding domain protein [Tanacetum cinerariifolium]